MSVKTEDDIVGWRSKMEEKRSELKIVSVALAIIACQVLGIDANTVTAIIGEQDVASLVSEVRTQGDGSMWAAVLAGVYAIGRSYLKGKIK